VTVPRDSQVAATVWGYAWASKAEETDRSVPPGTYAMMIGIDPLGGEDPDAGRITWTAPITTTDDWLPLNLVTPVEGPLITLFIRGQPLQPLAHNVSRWDSACLRVIGRAGEPPFTATPRPWPSRTPTPSATPNRATKEADRAGRLLVLAATATARAAVVDRRLDATTVADPYALAPEIPVGGVTGDAYGGSEAAGREGSRLMAVLADNPGLILLVLAVFVAGLAVGVGRRAGATADVPD
jgi:hypothetical protein